MINEKELRTGNIYATIRHHEITVEGIDTVNKFVTISSVNNNSDITTRNESTVIFEDLIPVEITFKFISQLGLSSDEPLSIKIISDNNAGFIWNEKLEQIVLADGNNGTIGVEIKYIHQFQNIYYFLTGKELPVT